MDGGTVIAVGDYIRLGGTNFEDAVVTLASDTYKVISLPSTTTIELDRPVQAANATYVDNGGRVTVIPAATGDAAAWGVAVMGQPLGFSVGKEKYKKMRFNLSLKDFGTSTITHSTLASEGSGIYEQIAELEWFTNGFKGEIYRTGGPELHAFTSDADSTATYDLTTIEYYDDTTVGFQANISPKRLILATPSSAPTYMSDIAADGGIWDSLELIAGTGKCYFNGVVGGLN